MKKNLKKLRLHRETLVHLDANVASARAIAAAIETSCTYPCNCPTGCSDERVMGPAEIAEETARSPVRRLWLDDGLTPSPQ